MVRVLDVDKCPHCGFEFEGETPRMCPSCGGSVQKRYLSCGCLSSAPAGMLLAWILLRVFA